MGMAPNPVKQIKEAFCKFSVTFFMDNPATTYRGRFGRRKISIADVFRGKITRKAGADDGANIFLTEKNFNRGLF